MDRLLGWQGRDSTRKKGMEAVTQRERGSPLAPHGGFQVLDFG